ncbi:hypothetical protein LCGC14_2190780, partial [marine sediment metagenome]
SRLKIALFDSGERRRSFLEAEAVPDAKTALMIFLVLAFVLWLDSAVEIWGQVIASLMTWALLAVLYKRVPRQSQNLLMSCLVVAMLGEVFCSLIWKLYDYRLFNIPAYVPPSHVLMFLLGSYLAPRMPRAIVWLVPALVAPYALMGYWSGFDRFGILLFIMFVACLVSEPERRLYATMFMLCLVLEIYGTGLGNWTWRPNVPIWGMSTTNPPISAGVFYGLLDFLMLRFALMYWSGRDMYLARPTMVRDYLLGMLRPKADEGFAVGEPVLVAEAEEGLNAGTVQNIR